MLVFLRSIFLNFGVFYFSCIRACIIYCVFMDALKNFLKAVEFFFATNKVLTNWLQYNPHLKPYTDFSTVNLVGSQLFVQSLVWYRNLYICILTVRRN